VVDRDVVGARNNFFSENRGGLWGWVARDENTLAAADKLELKKRGCAYPAPNEVRESAEFESKRRPFLNVEENIKSQNFSFLKVDILLNTNLCSYTIADNANRILK